MARAKIRRIVSASLDGLEVRNQMRDAARHIAAQIRSLHRARRSHGLDTLAEAERWLTDSGIHWSSEVYYSVTIIYAAGVTLAFLPTGELNSLYGPRMMGDEPEQFILALDEEATALVPAEQPAAQALSLL